MLFLALHMFFCAVKSELVVKNVYINGVYMKLLSSLFFLVAIPFSASATDNYHVECKSCVSDAQFVQAAKDNAIHKQTVFINVMNIDNYEMRKYSVYKNSRTVCDPKSREPDGEGGFIQDCWLEKTLTANEVKLTNNELNDFVDFASALIALRKSVAQRSIAIPDTVVPTAYDLIGASFRQTRVIDHFKSLPVTQNILESTVMYAHAGAKIFSTGFTFNAPAILFTFSDGSKAFAEFDFYDLDDNVHYKFTKVLDANGNQIDLTAQNPFPKIMDVSNLSLTSWQSLLSAFKAFGLAVRGADTKIVPRGTVTWIDCSSSTETVCRNPL